MKIITGLQSFFNLPPLRFDKQMEQLFQQFYAHNFLRHRRLVLILALVIIGAMGPFDFLVFGDAWRGLVALKYGFGLPFAILLGTFVFLPTFDKKQQEAITVCCLFYSFTLTGMLSIGPDTAVKLYQPAYLMLAFMVGAMARMLFWRAALVLFLNYLACNLLVLKFNPQPLEIILNYNIYYLGTAVMALASNYFMEQSIRREFIQIHSLQNEKQDLTQSNQELLQLACTDPLTCLYNRRHMEESFEKEWLRCTRNQSKLSLIMLDIDHFKKYNDGYGHQQGDDCLIQVAQGIRQSFRRGADIVARYGGEEFAILLPETDHTNALALARSLCDNIKNLEIPHAYSTTSPHVTVSIGVATTIPQQKEHFGTLIKNADTALYQAKDMGRGCVVSYTDAPETEANQAAH